ncbi:MAG: MgtC/SapB family protein [Phycisphaerales bacterium]|nr:MAG: MgtC/SapB family protein [Phycisphaerales bacterium]
MPWPDDVLSIVLATALGAIIGLEREFSGKAAGLRTNLLICLGASVFTILSRKIRPARLTSRLQESRHRP